MTTQTAPRPAAIAAVLAGAYRWVSAHRKSDGKPFFYVPGNTPGAVYMTAPDGCTCPSAQQRPGLCKHSVAVGQYLARRASKSDAEVLAQLKSDHAAQAKLLRLTGWLPDELWQNATYSQRAEHIARLEARETVAA